MIVAKSSPVGAATTIVLLAAAFGMSMASGSLAFFAETIRNAIFLAAAIWSAAAYRKGTSSDFGARFEFGFGKVEQVGNLALALTLMTAGLWIGSQAVATMVDGAYTMPRFGMALAATANGAILCLIIARERSDRAPADRGGWQSILVAWRPSRSRGLVFAIAIQTILTVAALVHDPASMEFADGVGAVLVCTLMTGLGIAMFVEAGIDMIDHPLPLHSKISGLLIGHGIHETEIAAICSRRAGRHMFIELTLDPAGEGSFDELRGRLALVRAGLERSFEGLDLSVRLAGRSQIVETAEPAPRQF
jgi:divalent metal cation (Fe/Co/Zn/Cd) transporter